MSTQSSVNCGDYVFQLQSVWKQIKKLQVHLKQNKKDYYGKLALAKLLSKRRKFLNYLKSKSFDDYQKVIREQSSKSKVVSS
ncbi:30S ribosomal protein S15 [Candidatus Mycoplasma haematolamae str. Purdue]|uniref:30S ribosomal protein S15 n=1 Tax=Mycoplasma haematolamae (strain Purdue) TaxID=1212765 RepID=I7B8T4_MYCHA|nr:30S ribosomal protein S15 [Candidatus Mycoplasma haematolamae]AFO51645.1 30S ribosomal protein S15 [Candidatus Mycoplasma haematolamae str. Purdue]